jgi:hypothetical protein
MRGDYVVVSRPLLTTNLSPAEAWLMFWLQVYLKAAGRDPLSAVKEPGAEGVTVEGRYFLEPEEGKEGSWFMSVAVYSPGTYMEPPDVDIAEIGSAGGAPAAAEAVVLQLVRDALQQAAEYEGERDRLIEETRAFEEWEKSGETDADLMTSEEFLNGADYDPDWLYERNRRVLRRAGL